jgi:adenylate kinase
LILLLFGPPGCGKGTQAVFLAERFHIPAISTGEVFRAECKAGTPLGKTACKIMSSGGLVGDDIVNGIVASRLGREDCAHGFLLDGYPRTVAQAESFGQLVRERKLSTPIVVHLDVADEVLVKRLTARRQCPTCLKIYNLLSQPPLAHGVCDDDGAALVTREDDCESVIRQRLSAYKKLTDPILEFYGPDRVHTVDGSQSFAEVSRSVEHVVLELMAGVRKHPVGK